VGGGFPLAPFLSAARRKPASDPTTSNFSVIYFLMSAVFFGIINNELPPEAKILYTPATLFNPRPAPPPRYATACVACLSVFRFSVDDFSFVAALLGCSVIVRQRHLGSR